MGEQKLIITIARSYGSGGRTLAKMLSENLNIPYFDKDIVKLASEKSGINEGLFGVTDEKLNGIFKKIKGNYKGKTLSPSSSKYTSDDNLFEFTAEVIKEMAASGDCIIVGRCADYILKDNKDVISLYFYATEEDCMVRLRNQVSGTDAELLKRKHEIDKSRAEYYKHYTHKEWNDATNYDFCLNTATMDYDKLVDVVKSYIAILRK